LGGFSCDLSQCRPCMAEHATGVRASPETRRSDALCRSPAIFSPPRRASDLRYWLLPTEGRHHIKKTDRTRRSGRPHLMLASPGELAGCISSQHPRDRTSVTVESFGAAGSVLPEYRDASTVRQKDWLKFSAAARTTSEALETLSSDAWNHDPLSLPRCC